MSEEDKKEAVRVYRRLGSPHDRSSLSQEQAEYLIDNYSDIVVAHGRARQIKYKKIIDTRYEVYTEAI